MRSTSSRDLEHESHLLARQRRLPIFRQPAQERAQIEFAVIEHFAARIKTGQRKEVVEQRLQTRRVLLHDGENLGLFRARHFREIDQVLDVAGKDRDRRPQFVRNFRDHVRPDFFQRALRGHVAQEKKRSRAQPVGANREPPRLRAERNGNFAHFVFRHLGERLPNDFGKLPARRVRKNNFSLRVEQEHAFLDPRQDLRPNVRPSFRRNFDEAVTKTAHRFEMTPRRARVCRAIA